jgi:chemotaxis family two-component system response regulator Rcp1
MHRWRILLAEDNAADAMLIEESMRRRSIQCALEHYMTAPDAIRAIEAAGHGAAPIPDLVLLDYNLPGGHGLDILSAISRNPYLKDVPKAIVSSFLLPDELDLALKMGANCVISKPTNLNEFFEQVGSKIEELLNVGCQP